jgi:hypothetical protein
MCLVCVCGLAVPHRLFVLLTHTSEHVCGVCGVLYRLFLTELALETDRKRGERKRGDFLRGSVPSACVWACLATPIVCAAHPH